MSDMSRSLYLRFMSNPYPHALRKHQCMYIYDYIYDYIYIYIYLFDVGYLLVSAGGPVAMWFLPFKNSPFDGYPLVAIMVLPISDQWISNPATISIFSALILHKSTSDETPVHEKSAGTRVTARLPSGELT